MARDAKGLIVGTTDAHPEREYIISLDGRMRAWEEGGRYFLEQMAYGITYQMDEESFKNFQLHNNSRYGLRTGD